MSLNADLNSFPRRGTIEVFDRWGNVARECGHGNTEDHVSR